ncbi:MucBP domain-containing protein [Listeria fleischmannii]|uniref:MucBP domain-containing protein n=1 Tax=Listeria fleischmannii TaxID=1069827 RepID=UPI0004BA4754|nr:MucBP domain-containing protein [Listeria fleischmannii]
MHLKKIVLPDSVISIGKNAFSSNQIEEVKLSKSLKDIPNFAFLANKLKSIDIPANIESIQTSAFENNNITNIHIENNNIQLSYGAFAAQTIIKQLIVPSDRILYVKDYIHFQDASSQLTLDHLTIRDLDDSIVYDTENKALIFSSEPKESTFSLFTGTTRYDSFYDISEYGPSGKSYLFFKYTGPVIVNYIDDQGANLAEATRIDGSMGEEYVSAPKEINGYTLKSNAKNATGQFTNKTQYVNYVYEKNTIKEGQVIVKYQDKFRNSLSENEFLTGEIGTSYTTKSKVIDGYKLIAVNGSPNGEFNLEPQQVTYIYEKLNNVAQGTGSSSNQNEKRLASKKNN